MKILFALLLVLLTALLGYHLTFRRFRIPGISTYLPLTGLEYLFVGVLLGPMFLDVVDEDSARGLQPLSALLLGWVGMLFGFQFEFRYLRRFPFEYIAASLTESTITFLFVFFGIYSLYPLFFAFPELRIPAVLTMAAAASCTAQTQMALFSDQIPARRKRLMTFLGYISSTDGLPALVLFGTAFLYLPGNYDSAILWGAPEKSASWFFATAGLTLLPALFLRYRRPESELVLIIIGTVLFSSGVASMLHFSPLIVNFILGFFLVNLSREKERLFHFLSSVEKPAYILLLLFLGIHWQFPTAKLIAFAAAFILLRFSGKMIWGKLLLKVRREFHGLPFNPARGLLESGGLPLAILLDVQLGFSDPRVSQIMGVVLIGIVFNDFACRFLGNRIQAVKK